MHTNEYIDLALRGLDKTSLRRLDFARTTISDIQEHSSKIGQRTLLCATQSEWKSQGRYLYNKTWGGKRSPAGKGLGQGVRKPTLYSFAQTFAAHDSWETKGLAARSIIIELYNRNHVSLGIDEKTISGCDLSSKSSQADIWRDLREGEGVTFWKGVMVRSHLENYGISQSFVMTNHILLHELGHALLNHVALLEQECTKELFREKEIEAELFGYVLGARLGFPMTLSTKAYLARVCRTRYDSPDFARSLRNIHPVLSKTLSQIEQIQKKSVDNTAERAINRVSLAASGKPATSSLLAIKELVQSFI